MATFGQKMRGIRYHLGYTQEEIANKLGVSKQIISRYEKEQTDPRLETVNDFADKLILTIIMLRALFNAK